MPHDDNTLADVLTTLVPLMRQHGMASCDVPVGEGQLKLELHPPRIAEAVPHTAPVLAEPATIDALSPEMGIFAEAVVEEGLRVPQNAILGFVEVGPLRLALEAPVAGTVMLCLVPVGSAVGYHQPVFSLQPD
ncbi:hypothetical protein [Komagataeibacter xylinus]|uniref:Acetyl-CoA carboxylase biotin carboxyl carrier protein subunit n=1 Tax=Komagataeibacter xylinus TaxID=28448 RepID=A0A857FPW8_KOMXY|nr:hypothetical protein [Komagataeibacter xylinus]QHC36323.1 hypothetical protein FMA36_13165 [Komagataeibacter xylinus]